MMSRSQSRLAGLPLRWPTCYSRAGSALAGWKEHPWCWRLHPRGCLTRDSAGRAPQDCRTDEKDQINEC